MTHPELYERIYLVTRQIPAGEVASYGDVAAVVGGGCEARTVGDALRELDPREAAVPWQRVVSRDGAISTRGLAQRELLEAESVSFDEAGRVRLARHRWRGPDLAWCEANRCTPLPPRDEPEQLGLW